MTAMAELMRIPRAVTVQAGTGPASIDSPIMYSGAGEFPLSNPESYAATRLLQAHSNIARVQSYHNPGGMILRGTGTTDVHHPEDDTRVYDYIGKTGEEIFPFYKYGDLQRSLPGTGKFCSLCI